MKQEIFKGNSPRVIVRLEEIPYQYLRYEIGFSDRKVDEFINELILNYISAEAKNDKNSYKL
jgi:hypothetical protein